MPVPAVFFLITRPVLLIVPMLIYLGFKEEFHINETNLKIEQKLFRLIDSPLEEFKSKFLQRASHELKTPLIPIKGHLDYILNEYSKELDQDLEDHLIEITYGYNKLEKVIKNFLLSLELESGELDLNKEEINVSSIIDVILKDLSDLLKLREHKVILDLENDLKIFADKERIKIVLRNMLVNAIKYTPSREKITIKSQKKGSYITISIQDNGIGITGEEKRILFQKFGKIERYGQGWDIITSGSGLGLFICKKIIEAHDGNMGVSSEGRNKGATFFFEIPIFNNPRS